MHLEMFKIFTPKSFRVSVVRLMKFDKKIKERLLLDFSVSVAMTPLSRLIKIEQSKYLTGLELNFAY